MSASRLQLFPWSGVNIYKRVDPEIKNVLSELIRGRNYPFTFTFKVGDISAAGELLTKPVTQLELGSLTCWACGLLLS